MHATQIKLFVEANFTAVPQRNVGDEMVFICPQPGCHDQSGNRSVNLKTGKTACFRCNVNGHFVYWLRKLGFDIKDEDNTSSTTHELEEMLKEKPRMTVSPVTSQIQLPAGCHRVADNLDSAYTRGIERMAIKKHLTLQDMIDADVMFTRQDPKWEPYAIFPIKEWNKLVLFQGRLVELDPDDPDKLSKRFPPSYSATFAGSRYWVYNIDELRTKGGTAIIVESILNVLSLRKKIREEGYDKIVPICIFKHILSKIQMSKILGCRGLEEVCFMYDADATAEALKQAGSMMANHIPTTVACMPWTKARPTLDPNDDIELAWQAFLKRERVSVTALVEASSAQGAKATDLWRTSSRQGGQRDDRFKNRHSRNFNKPAKDDRSGGNNWRRKS